MYSSITKINNALSSDDRFLNKLQTDPVYKTFKSSVDVALKKLYHFLGKDDCFSISSLEAFINNYTEGVLKDRIVKFQNINFSQSQIDRELIDGKGGSLQQIYNLSLKSIGIRAEAVTYYSSIRSAKNEIEQLINDFSTYLKGTYARELANYTQTDKNSKVDLAILVEKNIKDRLENTTATLFYLISDIDKGTENIRNLNKTAELLCKN